MNLADVFTIVFTILGFLMVFVSYWLMVAGLFPQFTERAAERIGGRPFRTFLVGLVTLGPLLIAGGSLSKNGPNGAMKALGLILLLLPLLAALLGAGGLALRIGQGLRSCRDETDPWRRSLRGSIVLGLTFVLPVLGTFLVLPYAFCAGFGAFLMGWRQPRLAHAAQPASHAAVPPLPEPAA